MSSTTSWKIWLSAARWKRRRTFCTVWTDTFDLRFMGDALRDGEEPRAVDDDRHTVSCSPFSPASATADVVACELTDDAEREDRSGDSIRAGPRRQVESTVEALDDRLLSLRQRDGLLERTLGLEAPQVPRRMSSAVFVCILALSWRRSSSLDPLGARSLKPLSADCNRKIPSASSGFWSRSVRLRGEWLWRRSMGIGWYLL
mmetsp:Transcript_16755/g.45377  ORF Transcript_16755/g.45377 Transcript_16755/m.45377 type:complete len:202 (+) Transcript_16755:1113-1718(+)